MKKIAGAIVSLGVVLVFTACAWQVPQKVSVKTKADYNFSLGNYEKELGEEMSMRSMMGNAGSENAAIGSFDYFPGKQDKNTQHYLLKVELLNFEILSAENAATAFGTTHSNLEIGSGAGQLNVTPPSPGKQGLDFNPSSILSEMASALGSGVAGNIAFAKVPLYLYCEAVPGVTAKATMAMFYGDKPAAGGTITERTGTRQALLDNSDISHMPVPNLEWEENTLTTNLAETTFLGSQAIDVKDVINSRSTEIQENDQLCIDFSVSDIAGTVSKADAINGIRLKLYAFIDLPLQFNVTNDIALDLSSMTGGDNSVSETAASSASGAAESSSDSEFSKYLEAVESISIKYVAFKLPFYSNYGMELGVSLTGENPVRAGLSVVDENKTITEADKSVITVPYTTVIKIKDGLNFKPNFSLYMAKNSVFSIPREKAVKLKIDLNLKTDGLVQIQ